MLELTQMRKIKILDCTFRDGGYYNNWNFDKTTVKKYIDCINNQVIDCVELGFRFLNYSKYSGKFSFISDKEIKKLKINKRLKLSIMINASDFIKLAKQGKPDKKIVEHFLKPKHLSPIRVVRVAAHFHEINQIMSILKKLKKYGYIVMLNLMQASNYQENVYKKTIKLIKKTKAVSVLYFADSLGCMTTNDVRRVCKYFNKYWKKEFGFHSHDNSGNALANCKQAIKNGVTWLDGTILGMGRGAGNVSTEALLTEINKGNINNQLKKIYDLSSNVFKKLKDRYRWGYSAYYHLASKYKIHPSYIQSILEENKYTDEQIFEFIKKISKVNSSSFDKRYLYEVLENSNYNKKFDNVNQWCKNKQVLILANGNSIKENLNELKKFVKNNRPVVLSININKYIGSKFIKNYVVSNKERIVLDFPFYNKLKKPLVIPINNFKELNLNLKNNKIINYGQKITGNSIVYKQDHCKTFTNLALAYCLCYAAIGKPKKIFLAGFDGYDELHKNKMNQDVFNKFKRKNNIILKSLTKTIYKI